MKRFIAAVLPIVVISVASFAQEPGVEAVDAVEAEAPAAAPQPEDHTPPPQPDHAANHAASPSYRLAVNFDENSLELAPLSAAALDSMSALFAIHNRNRYEVHGYSCPTIPGQKVIRLSLQRVERIVEHLMSLGIPSENIVTIVNAPKAAGAAACTEDRQVDIISSGGHWRAEGQAARLAEPQTSAAEAETAGSLKAEMAELKRRLAESEAAARAPAPEQPQQIHPVKADAGKKAVAVYMAGSEPGGAKGVHTIIGGELARVLSESDRYTAVDRTEAILEQLDREHVYQRSGAVDDDQIKALGHQLGVGYLCISNITVAGRSYYLDTRLVDVVTAEITRSVTATSALKDAGEMTRVGRNIALELLEAEKTAKQRRLRKAVFRSTAIGLDILGGIVCAYGYVENNNVAKNTRVTDPAKSADGAKLGSIADGPEAQRAAARRDAAYITGAALIAAGVTIHIVF